MLTLFLIRHAKSSWAEPDMKDFDRPLNDRGKQNAPIMGKIMVKKKEKPTLFVSSPAKRAFSTAKKIAAEFDYPKEKIIKVEDLYHASVRTWLKEVNKLPDEHQTVFVFGHNDGITEFCNYLTDGDILNIPTCGIVKIEFPCKNWKMISKGTGSMIYFDYPKLHSACMT